MVMRVVDGRLAYHPGRENARSARQLVQTDPAANSDFLFYGYHEPLLGRVILHGYEIDGSLPSAVESKDA